MMLKVALALLAGLIYSASGPEFGWWFLAPVGLGLILLLGSIDTQPKTQYIILGVFNLTWAGLVYSWLIHTDVNSAWLPFVFWLMATLCTAIPFTVSLRVVLELHKRGWRIYLALPTVWLVSEELIDLFARIFFMTTFDALRLGMSQVSGPFALIGAIGGVSLLSWFTASVVGLFTELAYAAWTRKRIELSWYFTVLFIIGLSLFSCRIPRVTGPVLDVAIIPQSVSSPNKIFEIHEKLLQHGRVDLAIWPEATLANRVVTSESVGQFILGDQHDFTCLLGAIRLGNSPPGLFNSAFLLKGNKVIGYADKRHPAPFLEQHTFIERQLGIKPVGVLVEPGTTLNEFDLNGVDTRMGVLICHDIFFPELAQELGSSKLIIHVSNESFARDSRIHKRATASGAMRAIESGKTYVRCALGGDSVVIDCFGKISKLDEIETLGYSKTSVKAVSYKTMYSRWSDYTFGAIFLSSLVAMAVSKSRNDDREGQYCGKSITI